jgi:phosphoribosylformylglycinamidine synthase
MALGPNKTDGRSGYLCEWVFVRVVEPGRSAFTCAMEENEVVPLPIAHAEGRFVTRSQDTLDALTGERLVRLQYCYADGETARRYPENPNGSVLSAAALSNAKGNVMAMMPHPERAAWLVQVPGQVPGVWGRARLDARGDAARMTQPGPGRRVFESLLKYMQ